MSEKLNLNEVSNLLQVRPGCAKVYIILLEHGGLTFDEIRSLLEYEENNIESNLQELEERGLIFRAHTISNKEIFEPLSLLQLEEKLARDKKTIIALKETIIPEVIEPHRLDIIRYDGYEGIRKAYIEVLEEAIKTGENVLAFETNIDASGIGETFFDNYIQKRVENRVTAYVIGTNSPIDINYNQRVNREFTIIRIIDDFELDSSINIVGDLIMSFSLKPKPQGTIKRDRNEAQTYKKIFYTLWNSQLAKDV